MDFKSLFTLILSLLLSSVCTAELKDPTKPVFYSNQSNAGQQYTDFLKLSSIWISGQTKRATINGITAKQGDLVLSDVRIIKINTNSVLIEQSGSRRTLSLLTRSYKKQLSSTRITHQ